MGIGVWVVVVVAEVVAGGGGFLVLVFHGFDEKHAGNLGY